MCTVFTGTCMLVHSYCWMYSITQSIMAISSTCICICNQGWNHTQHKGITEIDTHMALHYIKKQIYLCHSIPYELS